MTKWTNRTKTVILKTDLIGLYQTCWFFYPEFKSPV